MLPNEVLRGFGVLLLTTTAAIWQGSLPDRPPPSMENVISTANRPKAIQVRLSSWKLDREISWYGPGFYGNRTACGLRLTRELVGVAHRSLPCGTLIEFRWKGKAVVAPVVDRGPYVQGRIFDLTRAACKAVGHCFTGPIEWRKVRNGSG